jgi:hypothetical protein
MRMTEAISGPRAEAEGLGKALAHRFLKHDLAPVLLGKVGEKRALTYGDVETPGDAAAAAAAAAATSVGATSASN